MESSQQTAVVQGSSPQPPTWPNVLLLFSSLGSYPFFEATAHGAYHQELCSVRFVGLVSLRCQPLGRHLFQSELPQLIHTRAGVWGIGWIGGYVGRKYPLLKEGNRQESAP